MKTYSYSEIVEIVSQKINSYNYDIAIMFLDQQIQQAKADKNTNQFSLLSLLKSECCQKNGNLPLASRVLDDVAPSHLSTSDITRYETFRLKIAFQSGNWETAAYSANKLLDKHVNKSNILWRASSLSLLLGEKSKGEALSNQHRSLVSAEGFQAANNTLYTQTIPHLVSGLAGSSLSKELSPVKDASEIYLKSNQDFFTASQLGIRLKSFCQATLVESIVLYCFRNYFDAYFNAILTGLCIHHCGISLFAEGLGEIYHFLKNQYPEIFKIVLLSSRYSFKEFMNHVGKEFSDSTLFPGAYEDAQAVFLETVLNSKDQENLTGYKMDLEHTEGKTATQTETDSHTKFLRISDFY